MGEKERLDLILRHNRLEQALANLHVYDALIIIKQWAEDNNCVQDILDIWGDE